MRKDFKSRTNCPPAKVPNLDEAGSVATGSIGAGQSRRELFAGIFRYATLGLLGMVGGSVVVKRCKLVREGKCINSGICRGCEVFERCSLPQALSAKENPA